MLRTLHSCLLMSITTMGLSACTTMLHANKDDDRSSHGKRAKHLKLGEVFAKVELEPKSGSKASGKVWFVKSDDGVQVLAMVQGVEKGFHGFHIHAKGDCSAEDASSAGDHYNPASHPHGVTNPQSYHFGDLGNIVVTEKGKGLLNLAIPKSVYQNNFASWKDIIGKSVILHADPDDLQSQPSGNAGKRLACGVIEEKT